MTTLLQAGFHCANPRATEAGDSIPSVAGAAHPEAAHRGVRRVVRRWIAGIALGGGLLCAPSLPGAEKSKAPSTITEPVFPEIPNACGYLSAELAANLVRARVRPGPANEHIPTFWSQCVYTGQGVIRRQVGFVFKFMLWDLFDVAGLAPEQLNFNATFVVGNIPPLEKRTDLGKVAFVYEKQGRTTLLVVTGFQGPPDGAKRPTEFVATYYLSDPDTPHDVRLAKLVEQARKHMEEWRARK
jgi:hypothetical protein